VLAEVVSNTLAEVVTATGRWLAVEAMAVRGKRSKEDAAIAQWFDTYKLTDTESQFPTELADLTEDEMAEALRSNEIQASLHEILAARLTDAPELVIGKVRNIFTGTLNMLLGFDVDSALSGSLFEQYDTMICELVGRLEGGQPDLFRAIRRDAFSARIIAVLNAIESHLSMISDGAGNTQVRGRFLTNYRRHVIDLHGKLQPPDFDRRQRIPIDELYVPPRIIEIYESEITSATTPSGNVEYSSDTETAEDEYSSDTETPDDKAPQARLELATIVDRTVLLGDPGGGKSTASNVLMHDLASKEDERLPFLAILRDFASESSPNRSVVGYIEQRLETLYQCPSPAGLIRQLLLSGRAFVIFDGLDELVDTGRRVEVTEIVEQFGIEYPLAPILVTSRLIGYDQARLDDHQYVSYRLHGFDSAQVGEYVRKWFDRDITIDAAERVRWANSFMSESVNLHDLRSNPLLLALMCILYHGEGSIPRNRPELYQQCAEMLFRKWDARRHINLELRARYLIEPALRHLAYWLFTKGSSESVVTERELIHETTHFFYPRGFDTEDEAREAAIEFIHFCRGRAWVFTDAGTTATGETLYTFTHRTFMEYFAATYLATTNDLPQTLADILLPHIAKEEWLVVGELAIQKKDQINDRGAERVILAMLDNRAQQSIENWGNILVFLTRCLRVVNVAPNVTRQMVRSVLSHLDSGNPNNRIYFSPLTKLLWIPADRREIVRGEIDEWTESKIKSDDPVQKLRALQLSAQINHGIHFGMRDFVTQAEEHEVSRYWSEAAKAAVTKYSQEIKGLMKTEPSITFLALIEDLVTVNEVLSWEGDRLSFFIEDIPLGVFSSSWLFCLSEAVEALLGRESEDVSSERTAERFDDLKVVGAYLEAHPDIPWCYLPRSRISSYDPDMFDSSNTPDMFDNSYDFDMFDNSDISISVDPSTYLGLFAVLCMISEGRRGPGSLGSISHIGPYIMRRFGQRALPGLDELPALPIPVAFRRIFTLWATRDLDLTAET
jgi:hypothetical protein